MLKCYSDVFGNFPCDNGCLCDRCSLEAVEKVNRIRPESFVDDFDFDYCEDDDEAENDWRRGIVNGIRVDEYGLAIF